MNIHPVLVQFYLDPKRMTVYSGRWDVWLIQHKHWDVYNYLILSTDWKLNRLLNDAKEEAEMIQASPLWRALS